MLKDPDDSLVALFKNQALKNETKSLAEGRPIFDDHEVVEIRKPGSKDYSVHRATAVSHWVTDPETGGQVQLTYAERFRHQYQQFKMHATQTKSGTPLSQITFMTEGRKAELRAQNIYTVEALAAVDGTELKNLGPGGRDLKNLAVEFIEEVRRQAPNLQLQNELDALRARNTILEEDNARKKALEQAHGPTEFEDMSTEDLREYIATNTGQPPVGNVARKTLVRMAEQCRPEKVA